jgi:hypothetical protein
MSTGKAGVQGKPPKLKILKVYAEAIAKEKEEKAKKKAEERRIRREKASG